MKTALFRLAPLGLAALLAACATRPAAPPEKPGKAATPAAELSPKTLKYLASRNLKPIRDRELNVQAQCRFDDVSGGKGSLDLLVSRAEVRRFVAEIEIPKQGTCRFDLENFEQTGKTPNVVLESKSRPCTVRMWEQGESVTVAFNGCHANCGGDGFSHLWPILVDGQTGRCS